MNIDFQIIFFVMTMIFMEQLKVDELRSFIILCLRIGKNPMVDRWIYLKPTVVMMIWENEIILDGR